MNNTVEISKIIVAVKGNHVALKQVGTSETQLHISESESSKVAALEAFCMLMENIETNEKISDVVAHIFLPDVIYKPFINGTIATYIRLGKTRTGVELSLDELKLYNQAYDMYLARAKNLVIRNSDFKALDALKESSIKNEIKIMYAKLDKAIKKAERTVIVQQAAPAVDNSAAIAQITAQIAEAAARGDFETITALTGALNALNSISATPAATSTPVVNTTATLEDEVTENELESTDNKTVTADDVHDTFAMPKTHTSTGLPELEIKIQKAKDIPAGLAAFKNMK